MLTVVPVAFLKPDRLAGAQYPGQVQMFSVPPLVSFGPASARLALRPLAATAAPPASFRKRLRSIRSAASRSAASHLAPLISRGPCEARDASTSG